MFNIRQLIKNDPCLYNLFIKKYEYIIERPDRYNEYKVVDPILNINDPKKMSPDEYIGYLRRNILKYTSRIGLKGDPVEDSGKIVWYAVELNKYITQIKK